MADDDLIVVDDTSPTVFYSPFADTFGIPDFTAGWNPLFNRTSLGGLPLNVGNSTTVHVTARDSASFLINFQGTEIQLLGSAVQATYAIFVDDIQQPVFSEPSRSILTSVQGLRNANHTLVLTASIPVSDTVNQTESFIVFDRAIITSPASTPAGSSSEFAPQSLNDNAISFSGQWGFNQSNSVSFHQSTTVNDTARASFEGRSLQIKGTVSPAGGAYSVKLDNITTRLSARASFTQDNTLLFYTGNLDPNSVHTYEITNESGGALLLPVNGTIAFSSGDPNASPPPIPSQAMTKHGLSSGTIAALALAGILGFILITGVLFYFFVYRPRKQRQDFFAYTSRPMPPILDIAPVYADRHISGYGRWKHNAEGRGGSKDLGIIFRHSPSPSDKGGDGDSIVEAPSVRALSYSRSSKNSGSRSKTGSLKSWFSRKQGSSSSTPSYTLDLPSLQSDSHYAYNRLAPPVPTHHPQSSFSGVTSLSYLDSSSSDPSRQLSFNRLDDSSRNLPGQTGSDGLVVLNDSAGQVNPPGDNISVYPASISTQAPQVFIEEVASSYEESLQSRPSRYMSRNTSIRTDDRGSVRTYDDSLSVLGPSTARAAIRGLSPRTSESVSSFGTFGHYHRRGDEGFPSHFGILAESAQVTSSANVAQDSLSPPAHPHSEDEGRHTVDLRTGSPLHVDFRGTRSEESHGSATMHRPNRMSVRFDETQPVAGPSGSKRDSLKPLPMPPQSSFRLTPLIPLAPIASTSGSSVQDSPSFLDFDNGNGSSGGSHRTSSLGHVGSSISSRPLGSKSRWSNTTPSSHQPYESSSSPSSPSASFPFPVSLPASPHHPEGHKPSRPPSPSHATTSKNTESIIGPRSLSSDLNPTSPVESVPMSISDLHFRPGDSDDVSVYDARRRGSHLPPHPPLPSIPPTPTNPITNMTSVAPTSESHITGDTGSSTSSIRSSLPLPGPSTTRPPPSAFLHAHRRTMSADLFGRRPLGPRTREPPP